MTTKHTAGEWKIGDRQSDNHGVNILDSRGFLVAQARAAGAGWAEAKANAAFIVQACNNHDSLVEALEVLDAAIRFPVDPWPVGTETRLAAMSKAARAALEKAGAA